MKIEQVRSEHMGNGGETQWITAQEESGSSQLRKRFTVEEKGKAVCRVCGLGYGYFWLNGKKISEDLFTAPVSDYRKTLWYNEYDVTDLLVRGENIFAVWLGNGFFNESFDSAWHHDKAPWREPNKCMVELTVQGKTVLRSDESWKSNAHTAMVRNELRSGETFDFNAYDEKWTEAAFDDTGWQGVRAVPPRFAPVLRKCECQPIREIQTHAPINVRQTDEGMLVDFGTNFAGYVRLGVSGKKGDTVTVRHAESADANGHLQTNGLEIYYPSVPFQTDTVICDGKEHTYSPRFTYHGFRYALISGDTDAVRSVEGVEVHQQVDRIADFCCSDDTLNALYGAAVRSSLSNLHYAVTDCPTREKLGWGNDAAASLPQFFIQFDIAPLLKKWYVDIVDTQRKDGSIAGIAPSPDWGYDTGAVTDIYLFAVPYLLWKNCGDIGLFAAYKNNMAAYYDYYYAKIRGKEPAFGLGDWDGARNRSTDLKYIELVYAVILQRCFIALHAEDASLDGSRFVRDEQDTLARLRAYFHADGTCKQETVTAICMAMCLGIGDFSALKAQLLQVIDRQKGETDCGMVGRQFFYKATGLAGLTSLALQTLTREGSDYRKMTANGDTLWETCDETAKTVSHNHHMYSCFAFYNGKALQKGVHEFIFDKKGENNA